MRRIREKTILTVKKFKIVFPKLRRIQNQDHGGIDALFESTRRTGNEHEQTNIKHKSFHLYACNIRKMPVLLLARGERPYVLPQNVRCNVA